MPNNNDLLLNNNYPLLQLEEIGFAYDKLHMQFNLTVNAGETLAVLGVSGSGKSSLLNIIAGFNQVNHGNILFNGKSINQLTPAQRPMTSLFQEHNLFNHLTVRQNIAIGLAPNLKLNDAQKHQLLQAATQVELQELLDRLPAELSGGQRQRVGIARCLAREKPLLLLDEPFSALDPALRKEMLRLIKRLNKQQNITVIMVTHNPNDALEIADNIALIHTGKIVLHAPVDILTQAEPPLELQQYLGIFSLQ